MPGSFECPDQLLPSSEGRTVYCYASDGLYCAFDAEAVDALSCQPYAVLGASCVDVSCSTGLFCKDERCTLQSDAGRCDEGPEACTAQSYCAPSADCLAKKRNGEPCVVGDECTSNSCNEAPGERTTRCDSGSSLLARACAGIF